MANADELANAVVAARQHRGVDVDGPGLHVDDADQCADAEPIQHPVARCCALDEAEQRLRHGVINLSALAVVTIGVDQRLLGTAESGRRGSLQTLRGAPERYLIERGSMLEADERAVKVRGRGEPDPVTRHRRQQIRKALAQDRAVEAQNRGHLGGLVPAAPGTRNGVAQTLQFVCGDRCCKAVTASGQDGPGELLQHEGALMRKPGPADGIGGGAYTLVEVGDCKQERLREQRCVAEVLRAHRRRIACRQDHREQQQSDQQGGDQTGAYAVSRFIHRRMLSDPIRNALAVALLRRCAARPTPGPLTRVDSKRSPKKQEAGMMSPRRVSVGRRSTRRGRR